MLTLNAKERNQSRENSDLLDYKDTCDSKSEPRLQPGNRTGKKSEIYDY